MTNSDEQPEHIGERDSVFGDLNLLHRSLHDLDERGLVLSLAAFAEGALGSLLKAFMLPTDAAHQLLEGFNAPLGTFSSRIKAAHALGLITKEQFSDLEHLRKIRNEFAHSWQPIDFSHPKIAGHIKAFHYSNIDDRFPETPLDKVRSSLSSLLIELRSAAHQVEEKRGRVRVSGARLIAGFPGDFDQQLEAAREHLAMIVENLKTAVGEKRVFFRLLLTRLVNRLHYVESAAPKERRFEVLALLKDVGRQIDAVAE
ncbi:MAG: MltR family transcriptional regulator [Ralstonia sp.]|uniref:MltR family transcriptional regulator n=1 Tax=Ralstonia sp. TaxID=54061 RepID=UPI003F7D9D5D